MESPLLNCWKDVINRSQNKEKEMTLTEEQHSQLEKVVRPVIEWLNENCNSHTSIIVDNTNAELVEGIATVVTKEFVKD